MPPSETVFDRFGDFPTELRLAIWRQCLPRRVVELDWQPDDILWDDGGEQEEAPPCSAKRLIQLRNKAPPLLTRVCRESRQVAFETGRQLPRFPDPDDPGNTQDFAMYMVFQPWLDVARDVVHINWDPMADIEWQTYDWGDPVRCVRSYAAQTEALTASIRLGLLRAMEDRDEPHHLFRWTRSELADLMRARAPSLSWTVVIRAPIIVHATTATDSDLFGLLGDAPVQLVGASNKRRVVEFLQLGDRPGITLSPRLELGDLVHAQRELQDVVDMVFGPEKPAVHPVVMFRLCTEGCV